MTAPFFGIEETLPPIHFLLEHGKKVTGIAKAGDGIVLATIGKGYFRRKEKTADFHIPQIAYGKFVAQGAKLHGGIAEIDFQGVALYTYHAGKLSQGAVYYP